MARKENKTPEQRKLERAQAHIKSARLFLSRRTIFGELIHAVHFIDCENRPGSPQYACVDPTQAVIWTNPFCVPELGEYEWRFALAHTLAHLGLNHWARRGDRNPLLWNLACDIAANNMLDHLKIGQTPREFFIEPAFSGKVEEEIYDALCNEGAPLADFRSFAGPGLPDMVQKPPAKVNDRGYRYSMWQGGRTDYETLLAEGIRSAVEGALIEAEETFIDADARAGMGYWRPLEIAKRWVMRELPLLGALAAQIRYVADAELCDRMDIGIAAINPWIGEIYFHPTRGLRQSEILFVYVHELLHAALLHHSRLQGRDPLVWNFACDFVINGWLVEMGVGRLPDVGGLYDPQLAGMSAEEIYDLLLQDRRKCAGFAGKRGDIIWDGPGGPIYRTDVSTLDDAYRRAMATGLSCPGRGLVPAGLLEEIQSLFTPPIPWDVELARWMDAHVPIVRDPRRSYARASRRQSSTPDIPRPARYVPQEWKDSCTFGVIMDTSGSMDREMLGRALGAVASYAEARDVPAVRLVLCDATPYDRGFVLPTDLRGTYPVIGRGGTELQPAVNHLLSRADFPSSAPVMIITDGWCEERLIVPRDHCFVMPRKRYSEGNARPLKTNAPVFRVLKEER